LACISHTIGEEAAGFGRDGLHEAIAAANRQR
jgi:hypothetical protein